MAFEAYRDLVKLLHLGVSEVAGISAAERDNVKMRAAARVDAAAAAGLPPLSSVKPSASSTPSGAPLSTLTRPIHIREYIDQERQPSTSTCVKSACFRIPEQSAAHE